MDRLLKNLVRVFLLMCVLNLSACEVLQEQLPKSIYIDATFSDAQAQEIQDAIEEWNQVGRQYLGKNVLIYQGRYVDADGFSPTDDLTDDKHVIYNIAEPDGWYDYLMSKSEIRNVSWGKMYGYGLHGDVLLFDFSIRTDVEIGLNALWGQNWFFTPEQEEEKYLHFFYSVALHEIGHLIMEMHNEMSNLNGKKAVMASGNTALGDILIHNSSPPFLTQIDKQQFCLVYSCLEWP